MPKLFADEAKRNEWEKGFGVGIFGIAIELIKIVDKTVSVYYDLLGFLQVSLRCDSIG